MTTSTCPVCSASLAALDAKHVHGFGSAAHKAALAHWASLIGPGGKAAHASGCVAITPAVSLA